MPGPLTGRRFLNRALARIPRAHSVRALCSAPPQSVVSQGNTVWSPQPGRSDAWASNSTDGQVRPSLPQRVRSLFQSSLAFLLPREFPDSVAPSYSKFAAYNAIAAVASASGGVIAMQSLLHAVGLGSGSIPLAAALNWVLKDGIGQAGGIAFASLVNVRFDADPKKWRIASAMALDIATFVEVITPLFPSLFLPLAALANAGKNIAWLSASATRASMHNSLSRMGNLADITAKAGSQSIVCSTIGMLLGAGLSGMLGPSPGSPGIIGMFLLMSATHQCAIYAAMRSVELPTLNHQRAEALTRQFITGGAVVDDPKSIAQSEPLLPFSTLPFVSPRVAPIVIGAKLGETGVSPSDVAAAASAQGRVRHVLGIRPVGPRWEVHLLFFSDAAWRDVLFGYLHAVKVSTVLEAGAADPSTLRASCLEFARTHVDQLAVALEARGWLVQQPALEHSFPHAARLHAELSSA